MHFTVVGGRMLLLGGLLLVLLVARGAAASSSLCPPFCVCLDGLFLCQKGGLTELPVQLPSDTTRLILWHHAFLRDSLSRANFSSYPKAKYRISRLLLRNCSLRHVASNTFVDLGATLRELDLSHNHFIKLQPHAFTGLALDMLKLDGNVGLELNEETFLGMAHLVTLSMAQCGLKVLTVQTVQPVWTRLENLDVSYNHLEHLEKDFEPLVRSLERVELHHNHWKCDCRLRWMGETLLWRRDGARRNPGRITRPHFQVDQLNDTQCATPNSLFGVALHLVVEEGHLLCKKLSLKQVTMNILSREEINMACGAEGSSSLKIDWSMSGDDSTHDLPSKVHQSEGLQWSTVHLNHSSSSTFTCHMQDSNDNASVVVHMNWDSMTSVASRLPNASRASTSAGHAFLYQKQFNLMELLLAMLATFLATCCYCILHQIILTRLGRRHHKKSTTDCHSGACAHCVNAEDTGAYQEDVEEDSKSRSVAIYDMPMSQAGTEPPNCPSTLAFLPATSRTGYHSLAAFHNPLSSNSFAPSGSPRPTHFIDFKTQERLLT